MMSIQSFLMCITASEGPKFSYNSLYWAGETKINHKVELSIYFPCWVGMCL